MNNSSRSDEEVESIPLKREFIGKKIAMGGLWAFWGRIASVLLVVAVNGLASRLLSHQEMGAYFLSLSFVAILSILIQFGLNHGIVKLLASEIALQNHHRVRGHVYSSLKVAILLSLAIVFILSREKTQLLAFGLFDSALLRDELGWIAAWAALYSVQNLLAEVWRGLQKIDHATLFGGLSTQFFTLACLGILMTLGHGARLHGVVLIAVCSLFISILLSFLLLIPHLARENNPSETSVRELLTFSWPFLFASLTMFMLSQADLWLVGFLSSESVVAFYGAATRITLLTTMPLAIVNSVIPPFLAERHTVGDRASLEAILRSSSLVAFLPALLLYIVYWFFGTQILEIIFGPGYAEAMPFLLILSGGYTLHILAGSPGYTLMMTGYQKQMMAITIGAATVMITLGYFAGKAVGPIGVAWASFVGLIGQTAGMWIFARIKVGVWTHPDLSRICSPRLILKYWLETEPSSSESA